MWHLVATSFEGVPYFKVVVGPVLKRKTGFQGFETEQIPGFQKFTDMIKSFMQAYTRYVVNRKWKNRKYAFGRYFEVCKLHLL